MAVRMRKSILQQSSRCTFREDRLSAGRCLGVCFVNGGEWSGVAAGMRTCLLEWRTQAPPHSLALCPQTLGRTHLFIMVIPLSGILPKKTVKSATQRYLCKDVRHSVICEGENLEAV